MSDPDAGLRHSPQAPDTGPAWPAAVGAAAEDRSVSDLWAEGRGRPGGLWVRGLDVKVGVDERRREGGVGDELAVHSGARTRRILQNLDGVETGGAETVGHPICGAEEVGQALWGGGDAGEGDQRLQLFYIAGLLRFHVCEDQIEITTVDYLHAQREHA